MTRRMAVLTAMAVLWAGTADVRGQATAPAPDKAYAVVLHRTCHVGDKFNNTLKVIITKTATITAGGQPAKEETETTDTELSGVVEVTAVNKQGDETGTTMTVDRFVKIAEGKATPLLDKGAVVVMTVEAGKRKYALKGGEMPAEALSALEGMHPGEVRDDEPTDDETFGTKEAKKVGQTWAVDAAANAKAASLEGQIKVDAKDISGTMKLAGVKPLDGKECVEVTGDLAAENIRMGDQSPFPPGLAVQKGTMHGTLDGWFPTDPTAQPTLRKFKMNMEMVIGGQLNGNDVSMTVKGTVDTVEGRTPVK